VTVEPLAGLLLGLITAERLGELVLARANTARLKRQGGVEHGAGHYPLFIALHGAWLLGLWALAHHTVPSLPLVALFACVEIGRAWVLLTLGRRWTTRIVVVPGERLVRHGPYRFLSHPNYVVVCLEILILPLAFGLVAYALVFSVLNALLLAIRLRAETAALASTAAAVHPIGEAGEVA
jgi:methyltransferase